VSTQATKRPDRPGAFEGEIVPPWSVDSDQRYVWVGTEWCLWAVQPTYEELQERVTKLEMAIRYVMGYKHPILPLPHREILMNAMRP
jgi:hypothetical protein